METKKDNKEVSYSDDINKIIYPIFDKVLQETPKNHTMVGGMVKNNQNYVTPSLYNPHNYRLYFNFTKQSYTPKEGMVGVWFGKLKNHGKEFTATGEGIRVTIKKTKAEVINKLTEEEWFLVNRSNAKEEIMAILNRIDQKCIASFRRFIEQYGGSSDFTILNRENKAQLILNTKCDNKIMKEPFVDSLPLNLQFETDIVKKVYKKPNVEFKEPIYAAHHLENSALNEFSPEIAGHLKCIKEENKTIIDATKAVLEINQLVSKNIESIHNENKEVMLSLQEQIRSHLALIQEYRKEAEYHRLPFWKRWLK